MPAASAQEFVQDRFAIGFWVDPPADENMEQHYLDIANANFTLVLGSFGARTPIDVERQLELCERHDLKALVWTGGLEPEEVADGPACWGYMIRDEPSVADFAPLAERANALRAARPGKIAYINLLPNYANAQQLGAESYDEHVGKFIEVLQPEVLCMDHYPVMKPSGNSKDNYCVNLEVMRKHSLLAGIPHWNFFNTMPYGPHFDPTEADLRWQIYTAIAYGSKGVLYFCYWTPGGGEFPKGGAIIGRDGRKTRHYGQATRINACIKALGPTIMQLTSTGVVRVEPKADVAEAIAGSPIKSLAYEHTDWLIGTFTHSDGRRAVLLSNYDTHYTSWPTVEFDVPADQVIEVSQETGEEAPVIDDSPDMEGLQISLDSGEGRLFLLP